MEASQKDRRGENHWSWQQLPPRASSVPGSGCVDTKTSSFLVGSETEDEIAKVIFMALQIEASGGVTHFIIADF